MKRAILSLFITLCAVAVSAQKQANVWVFGNNSGMDFNSGAPVPISSSLPLKDDYCQWCPPDPRGYNEGASSICDSAGNLLFYSNGERVWNRYNHLLPHGDSLMGNFSATQAALILPKPGSNSLFYLFTIDCFQDTFKYGLHYSVIDACLDSGRGDIAEGMKNIPLMDSTGEKLTAVKVGDGADYWIIAHKFWTDKFYAFRLTSSGIVDTVITHIGRVHVDTVVPYYAWAAIGTMTASPDGRHIALVNGNMQSFQYLSELFDFDVSTGMLSNYVDLETRSTLIGSREEAYGCSFSPDSKKLYIGGFTDTAYNTYGNPVSVLAQYDISMGAAYPDSIRNSVKWISAANEDSFQHALHLEFHPNSMQIGPDKKMYASGGGQYLWVINNPDSTGNACNARIIAEFTVGRTMTMPNILPSYFYGNAMPDCLDKTAVPAIKGPGPKVSVYPNPVQESFTIVCPGRWKATLIDFYGRKIINFSGTDAVTFSRDGIAPGMYILSVQTNDGTFNDKIVIE